MSRFIGLTEMLEINTLGQSDIKIYAFPGLCSIRGVLRIKTWLQLRIRDEYWRRDSRLDSQEEKFRLNVSRKKESQSHS